jgi:beta-lactamase class D
MIQRRNVFGVLGLILIAQCVVLAQNARVELRNDLRKHFDRFHLQGSFVLYDLKEDTWILSNRDQLHTPFTPASTFKICNSLIGLETGVIPNENYVITWDKIVRGRSEWNKDHDMKMAFKNSTVWFYQELARRVGGERMKQWLDRIGYGNADTSGGIDRFWLSGGLRITPEQQILFLKRLFTGELPFSRRTLDIVRRIMIAKDTVTYTIRAKTGWGDQDGLDIGWYVGYVQKKTGVYFFATCAQRPASDSPDFLSARIEITTSILKELGIL